MAQQLTPLQMAKELYRLQNGGKDKPGRKPVFSANQFYPWKVEREMERYVAEWLAVNGERLKNLALIGYAADGLDDLNSGEVFVPEDASAKAGEFFSRVQGFASESLDSFAERTVGRKIGFYSNDSEMRNAFVDNFVAQCKSASEDQKKEIAAAVYRHRMFPNAEGPSLVKEINTINEKYTRKKARFIARNETGNLNAAQQRRQMQGAGFSMYEWMSMPDGVTRDTHRNMNGLVCRWDDDTVYSDDGGRTWKKRTGDMYIGVPGQDFNCRCTAVPFESEFEDEYEVKSLPEDDDEPGPEPIRETKAELMAKLEEQTERAEKAEADLVEEKYRVHALRDRIENMQKATALSTVKDPTRVKDAIKMIKEAVADEYSIPETAFSLNTLNSIRAEFLKIAQLTGVGKFDRISALSDAEARNQLITALFQEPNVLKVYIPYFKNAFEKPKDFFERNVSKYLEAGKNRFLAIEDAKNVKKYIIAHEVGHKIFYMSKLEEKGKRLKELFEWAKKEKILDQVGDYAKLSAASNDYEEFFAEIFALWAQNKVSLNEKLCEFVERILE